MLLELDKKVFGKITTKEIIGANPSYLNDVENLLRNFQDEYTRIAAAIPDAKDILERELAILLVELDSKSKEDVENILKQQKIAEKHVNSRPGAMALAQQKIQLFNQYNEKYLQAINEKLSS